MSSPTENLLLAVLSTESRQSLIAHATAVPLPLRTVLYETGDVPRYAYFLTSGFASVVTSMVEGGSAEVGVIGREGIVGSFHLLGPSPNPTRCFMQLAGAA
jgi:CRP-like cAMP-binding protein